MPHDRDDLTCPKCGTSTIEQPHERTICPGCGAQGEWDKWCGDTESGYYDGPVEWKRLGWVATSAGAPLPHIAVVGWYGHDELMVLVHDGQRWLEGAAVGAPAAVSEAPPPLYWLSLPPDPA